MATPVQRWARHAGTALVTCLLLVPTARTQGAEPPPTPVAPPQPAPGPQPAAPPAAADVTLPDLSAAGPPTPLTLDFEGATGPALPAGLFALSGHWTVADAIEGAAKSRFLLQDRETPPWAVVLAAGPGRSYADGKVTVRFQLVSGIEDASAGIVFRAQGKDDYYLCRTNGLEDNLRLYVTKGGTRWPLTSTVVDPPKLGTWHTLEVEFVGDALKGTLDGKATVEAKDKAFAAGWCGLWTKQDSVTRFDDWTAVSTKVPAAPTPAPSPRGPTPGPKKDR